MAYTLFEHGFALLPLYTRSELSEMRVAFDVTVASMPELKPPRRGETLDDRPIVGGGTSFAGGSICHSETVRKVELDAYTAASPLLRIEGQRLGMPRLAQVKDRICFRPRGLTPYTESAHRDLSPHSPCDRFAIFGGWVPLNDEDGQEQFFSCVPGTHNDVCMRDDKGGFRSLTDAEKKEYKGRMRRFKIPMGHMLVFDQRLIHEVVADKKDYAIRRVFIAFELSKEGELPLWQRLKWTASDIERMFEKQGPFLLKSGQECRTYPKMWVCSWPDRLKEFSKKRVRKWVREGRKGRVQVVYPSLRRKYRHPAWTEAEKARFFPH